MNSPCVHTNRMLYTIQTFGSGIANSFDSKKKTLNFIHLLALLSHSFQIEMPPPVVTSERRAHHDFRNVIELCRIFAIQIKEVRNSIEERQIEILPHSHHHQEYKPETTQRERHKILINQINYIFFQ